MKLLAENIENKMTDQKQEKRALIEHEAIKPLIDALALAGGCSSTALIPMIDNPIGKAATVGFGFSCFWYWGRGNLTSTSPKRKKPRRRADDYKVNWGDGTMRRFEQIAPDFITRQSLWADIRDLVRKPKPRVIEQPPIRPIKPRSLEQFAFMSWDDNGNPVQLLSCDVRNFLRWARRKLDKGKTERGEGLGKRSWDNRSRSTWPDWYPGPRWYEAMMVLLVATEVGLKRQLIDVIQDEPRRIKLRYPAWSTYEHILWWYTEGLNYRAKSASPSHPQDVIDISFDWSESSFAS